MRGQRGYSSPDDDESSDDSSDDDESDVDSSYEYIIHGVVR